MDLSELLLNSYYYILEMGMKQSIYLKVEYEKVVFKFQQY